MRQISAIVAGLLLLAGAIWWVSRMEPPAPIEVENARIRLVPGGGPMAGYMRLGNHTDDVVRFVGAEARQFGGIMIHRTVIENGQARMEHQSGGIRITPGDAVEFEPRGLHLMLMRPQDELNVGDTVDIVLEFEGGGPAELTVPFVVVPVTAQ
ncbi:MAG: copper chaperone PCu(A)C [Candidatus Wenzhouxiangella sp. M2_3B_020]